MSSYLLPRTSGLVKPGSSSFFPGAAASPLLPASTSARPLLPFSTGPGSPLFQPPAFQPQGSPMEGPELSLASVHVPLESIKPSRCCRLGVGLGAVAHSLQRCWEQRGWVGTGFSCPGPLEPNLAHPTAVSAWACCRCYSEFCGGASPGPRRRAAPVLVGAPWPSLLPQSHAPSYRQCPSCDGLR